MLEWIKNRNNQIMIVFFILVLLLIGRLLMVSVFQNEEWTARAEGLSEKTVYTPAPRGEIYDRNGELLAGSEARFSVNFSRDDMDDEELNESILNLIKILKRNGDKLEDEFPIKLKNGKFSFTYDKEIKKWLKSQKMPTKYTAEDAFNELRKRNDIDPAKTKYEAQSELLNSYGISPPISVKRMEYTQDQEKRMFFENYNIEGGLNAKEAFNAIRENLKIPENLSAKKARQLIVVRNQLASQGYKRYMPSTVATGVSEESVTMIEENGPNLPGVSVITESTRYYPNDESASHILGYMGKISEANKEEYVKKGYRESDLVGQEGVEKSQEEVLRGKDGTRTVQVNSSGEFVNELGKTESEKGKDIFLTIDMRLQKTAEESLKNTVNRLGSSDSGGVVALNVETGEPLAIASYPNYDPNLFAEGINDKDWDSLQGDNPRDALDARPLYNVAARTAVQPGSTFKPMTAIAALECGLNPYRYLHDGGYIKLGNRTYGCMIWNVSKGSHGSVNLASALQVSCNYYFFDVGTGKDWASGGASLGYNKKISIDLITKYAKQFGLGVESDIEIPESVIEAPTAEKKMDSTKKQLRRHLISKGEAYFNKATYSNESKLLKAVDEIVSWTEENPELETLKKKMVKVGVKKSEAYNAASDVKYSYYNFAEWSQGDGLNISIGQGENAFTPLQMANYMATIANGGVKNSLSLIRAVEGEGKVKRKKGKKTKTKKGNLKYVVDGMRRAANSGTLASTFNNMSVSVAGKTGTAERSGRVNPPDEVKYVKDHLGSINGSLSWKSVKKEMERLMKEYPNIYTSKDEAVRKAVVNLSGKNFKEERIDIYKSSYEDFAWVVAFAPADDPKIAVACLIVQGGKSTNAGPVVKDVINKYMKILKSDEKKKEMDYEKFLEDQ